MNQRRVIEIFVHLLFWGASTWLLVSGYSIVSIEYTVENGVESKIIERDSILMGKIVVAILLSAALFYGNLFILSARRSLTFSRSTLLSSVSMLPVSFFVFHALSFLPWVPEYPALPANLILGMMSFYYAMSSAYGLGISWYKSEEARKNLVLEKNQAELSLLRNQLQPHFLFNALNNLLSLINEKHYTGARDAVEKLAHLLRYIVDENRGGKVALEKEIDFIKNYISLQMLRFDPEEVKINLSIMGTAEGKKIEPGLFLPFVENAFKYGTEPEGQSNLDLVFDMRGKHEIYFSISNPNLGHFAASGPGTGIDATRKRLNLVYPGKYNLEIIQGQEFTVQLKLYDL